MGLKLLFNSQSIVPSRLSDPAWRETRIDRAWLPRRDDRRRYEDFVTLVECLRDAELETISVALHIAAAQVVDRFMDTTRLDKSLWVYDPPSSN